MLRPGTFIAGTYCAQRRIAQGGIGEVWAAIHTQTQRAVAIKRLLPAAAAAAEIVARFEREGELLGRIYSDFVVRRVDMIKHPVYGRLLIQEFVEGEALSEVLRRRRLSVEEARELGFNLLRALVALERASVVHCDLKPANLILKPLAGGRLRPILIDFGAARTPGWDRDECEVGTFEYMAPEQFQGAPVTHAVDLYAVGAILYRAVTGRRPFGEAAGPELVKLKCTKDAPPLFTGRSDWMAQRLQAVVGRALRRNPAERYHHADDMLTELMELPRSAAA